MAIDPIRDLYYSSSCLNYCVNIASITSKVFGGKGVANGKNGENSKFGFGFLGLGLWNRY